MMARLLIFFTLIFSTSLFGEYIEWSNPDVNVSKVKLNDLRFTNRATCALDSKKPTESALLLINNMDAVKAIYRLGKVTGLDARELAKTGVQVFRYTALELLQLIHYKLMTKKLPLLPSNVNQRKGVPSKYKLDLSECKNDEYCENLDLYLEETWRASQDEDPSYELNRIDDFDKKRNFITEKISVNKQLSEELSCQYLKKFSPLEAHLYGTKPNQKVLNQLAKVMMDSDNYVGDCHDFENQEDIKVGLYKLELNALKEKKWNKVGFNYWNSLKLYFSWAWRNAPEFDEMASPFSEVFRGVEIESSILLIPNGCKSIDEPKCNGDYLALNKMRDFAKKDFRKEAVATDILDALPKGPQQDLLDNEFPPINTDIADLSDFPSATDWFKNFSDNLGNTRTILKMKLIHGINFLNLAHAKLSPDRIFEELKKRFSIYGFGTDNQINIEGLEQTELKILENELYYLCGEFNQASNKDYSFIRNDLEILRKTTIIDRLSNQLTDDNMESFFGYYEKVSNLIQKGCNDLNQKEIWKEGFKLDKTGFSKWYVKEIYEGKVQSNSQNFFNSILSESKPLLYLKSANEEDFTFENTICINGSHCARKTLASIIDLYAVVQYANTLWSMDQKLKTPAIFNPYAERTQCKVYDPWFKTKQTIFNFFLSMGQAAMSAFVPGAVFANMDLIPGRVVSFKQLIKEGKIEYDINRSKTKVAWGLVTDFGPLLGIPCQVSISRHDSLNPYSQYAFGGVSVNACYSRERTNINIYSGGDIRDPSERNLHVCAGCTLNFYSVANSLTAITSFTPYVGPGLFLFKGLIKLYQDLKSPQDIPRNWKVNPNHVLDTYRRFGEIPKKCVKKLRKGKSCLKNHKEVKINDLVRKVLKTNIIGIDSTSRVTRKAMVKVHGCEEMIEARLKVGKGNGVLNIPTNCAHLVRGQVEERRFRIEGSENPIPAETANRPNSSENRNDQNQANPVVTLAYFGKSTDMATEMPPVTEPNIELNIVEGEFNGSRYDFGEEGSLEEDRALAERMLEEGRRLEEERRLEETRLSEEARIREEGRRLEAERRLEETRLAEAARIREEGRRLEAERRLEETRLAEADRMRGEARRREEARRLEETRLSEADRMRGEARRREEARRLETERRLEEARSRETARIREEERRLEEAARIREERRRLEEERRIEETRSREAARVREETRRREEVRRREIERLREETRRREEERTPNTRSNSGPTPRPNESTGTNVYVREKYVNNLKVQDLKSRDCFIKKISKDNYLLFLNKLSIKNVEEVKGNQAKLFLKTKTLGEKGYLGHPLLKENSGDSQVTFKNTSIILNKNKNPSLTIFSELENKVFLKEINVDKCGGAKSWLRNIGQAR